jgi:hypothetical protein
MLLKEKIQELSIKINELSRKCTYIRRYESEEELKAFQEMITSIEDLKNFDTVHKYIKISYGYQNIYLEGRSRGEGDDFKFWNLSLPFDRCELISFVCVEVNNKDDVENSQNEKFKTLSITGILELVIEKMSEILEFKQDFSNFLESEVNQ